MGKVITTDNTIKRLTELERQRCCNRNQFLPTFDDFPTTGEDNVLYIDKEKSKIYLWNGSIYITADDLVGHTNIVATTTYDSLNPLTGWVAPTTPYFGNTATVLFTDDIIVNFTFNGTIWEEKITDDAAVSGTGATNRVAFWSDVNTLTSDADLYWDDTNNMLGIGTTTPAKLLDVDGDALINGLTIGKGAGNISTNTASGLNALFNNTTGYSNTASGFQALYTNTTGNSNTASGFQALYTNTTGNSNTASGYQALFSNTTGNSNTASGYQALFSNTTGNYNTASGRQALYSNTTGTSNTASGYYALYSNTTGNYNTASGRQALYSNTTGTNNVASGRQALFSNTTGADNTASGYYALYSNTTGNYNTASGRQALYSNTTGTNNVASGYQALYSNTTGASNTASGYYALFSNTTGANNTASGYYALYSNTTGLSNLALGLDSGRYIADGSTANTITDNSVYIGVDSRALANNQTNQIVIGHTAIGGGSNTATIGNSSVTVLYLAGSVGWFQGNGTPEAAVAAPVGSFYSRKDGGAGTSFYVKESGSGNTGWIGK